MYATPQAQFSENNTATKLRPEYSYILSCKNNKKVRRDIIEEAERKTNEYKFVNYVKNHVTSKEERSCKSPELGIKKEVDADCCVEDSNYDPGYATEKDYYDLSVKREVNCKSGDDDENNYDDNDENFKNENISSNSFVDNMFKEVGPLSDSLVECRVCYKQIKETSKRQHCNTHTGLKPYSCCFCGSRFTRKGDALRHRKTIHRNIKPFECIICHKNFAERKLLITHLRNHDRAVYFSCATCGFKFGKREYFQSHIQYVHPSTKKQSISEMRDNIKKGKRQLEKLILEENVEGQHLKICHDDHNDNVDSDLPNNRESEENKVEEKHLLPQDFKVEPASLQSNFSRLKTAVNRNKVKYIFNKTLEDVQDTDIKTGTLCFTQKILPPTPSKANSYEDEDLVNKAINSAISQSKCVLEKISYDGSNLTSIFQKTDRKQLTKKREIPSVPVTGQSKHTEVHITANFGGSLRKFIIHIPNNNIDPLCKEGLDSLLNMVNYVCSGRDNLIGPVEIELH